jgi:hypothetical protein
MAWVPHEDSSLDHVYGCGLDRNCSACDAFIGVTTSTESVIHDLSALK